MFRSNQLPRIVLLCLSVLWSGILFPVNQPWAVSRSSEAGIPLDRFLTLPFLIQADMRIVQGWTYTWWYAHFGIDYILGDIDSPGTWKTFDVVAAADGEACANCVNGPGNKVWIKHTVGNRVYYTYYGHLATIEPNILYSRGASMVKVIRGQKIGTAGNTGTWYIHLHFGVYNASWVEIDPYDLYSSRSLYNPNPEYQSMGSNHLFMADPPPDPSQVTSIYRPFYPIQRDD